MSFTDHTTESTLRASNRNKPYRPSEALEVVTTCKLPLHPHWEGGPAMTISLRGALGFLTSPFAHCSFLVLSTILYPKESSERSVDLQRAYPSSEHDKAIYDHPPPTWTETNLVTQISVHGSTLHKFFFRLTASHLARAASFAPWAVPLLLPRRLPSALRYAPPSATHPESLSLWLRLT